jgi:hypothetical protein
MTGNKFGASFLDYAEHRRLSKEATLEYLKKQAVENLVDKITDGQFYTVRLTCRTEFKPFYEVPMEETVLEWEINAVTHRDIVLPRYIWEEEIKTLPEPILLKLNKKLKKLVEKIKNDHSKTNH